MIQMALLTPTGPVHVATWPLLRLTTRGSCVDADCGVSAAAVLVPHVAGQGVEARAIPQDSFRDVVGSVIGQSGASQITWVSAGGRACFGCPRWVQGLDMLNVQMRAHERGRLTERSRHSGRPQAFSV